MAVRPGFIGAGAYHMCPVDGCAWKLSMDQSFGRIAIDDLSPEGITAGISRHAMERARETERVLREHLESHDVLDFLRTIKRLENDLAQQGSGIRPHVYSPE